MSGGRRPLPVAAALLGVAALLLAASGGGAQAAPGRPTTVRAASGQLSGAVTTTAPAKATVVIGLNAAFRGYTTPTVRLAHGGRLRAVNHDRMTHTVTSVAHRSNGAPLFDVVVAPGQSVRIPAASHLAAGRYAFFCRIHPSMRGTLVIVGSGGGTHPAKQTFDQPLVVPKVLTGSHITIHVKRSSVRMLPNGPLTPMWTYNGTYPGPTIRRPAGSDTKVTFVDDLPKSAGSLTVHLHGDHHTSADDGRPNSQLIAAGRSRTYDYPLTDAGRPERSSIEFYHDHRMGVTGRNNWRGLQGLFIVDNPTDRRFDLPRGAYDVPLVVSDRSFTSTNRLTDPFPSTGAGMPMPMTGPNAPPGDATVGNRILVNGRYAPYLKVATHRYRLRLVNTSNFQSYDFALSDGRRFRQIGTGSGLLPHPVARRDILLGPAQRADVVVDFGGELGKNVVLKSIPRTNKPALGIGTPTASIMQFRVRTQVADHSRVPSTLLAPPRIVVPAKVSTTWAFGLGGNTTTGTYWTVNGKPFDPRRIDAVVPLGSTRLWKLVNTSSVTHYIHLHEEQWHTVSRDGHRPPPWERGLEDTWRLDPGESVKVAARFTDYTGDFMIHCHMLAHEDHGMMAQFAVVPKGSRALPAGFYLDTSTVHLATRTMTGHTMTGHTMTGHTMTGHTMTGHTMTGHTARPVASVPVAPTSHFRALITELVGLQLVVVAVVVVLRRRCRPATAPIRRRS